MTCPPPTFSSVEGGQNIRCPPTIWDWKKSHISICICILRSFLLDLSGPHVFTLYLYSDILSMYSIQRMRRTRNQSHNDLHFSKTFRPPPPFPSVALRLHCLQLVALNIYHMSFINKSVLVCFITYMKFYLAKICILT